MARPKKEGVGDAPKTNGNGPRTHADVSDGSEVIRASENAPAALPLVPWLSLVKAKGGYAVLKAVTLGREVQSIEVLHGPLGRTAASAALRSEMARAYLVGRGPT